MKRYKHVKTGVVIETTSNIIGKAWVPLDVVPVTKSEETTEETTEKTEQEYIEEEIVLEDMTNKELEKFAKSNGIELTTADKKNKETRIEAIAKAFEESEE